MTVLAKIPCLTKRFRQHEAGRFSPASFLGNEGGVSAIEFALFAPLLAFGFLTAVDLGMAAYQKMTMEHVLRAGAQSAMTDAGATNVLKVLRSTAAENFTLDASAPTASKPALTVSAERYCICPDAPEVHKACSTICEDPNGSVPTRAYYRLSATRTYSGMFIPDLHFNPQIQVQVR